MTKCIKADLKTPRIRFPGDLEVGPKGQTARNSKKSVVAERLSELNWTPSAKMVS